MKIFQAIQRHLAILGITVNQLHKQSSISPKHLTILLIMILCVVAQIICIISIAETFEEYTLCIYGSFTLAVTGIEFGIHIWKLKQIFKFIENFEQLIESRLKYPISKTIYMRSNDQIEKLSHTLNFTAFNLSLLVMMVPLFVFSFCKYFLNGMDNDAFQLPFFGWFPFDWHNPIGYLIAFAMEYISAFYALCILTCQTSFLIGSCRMLVSLAEDITCELQALDDVDENAIELTEKFMNYIQLHSEAKQLVLDFTGAYEYNIMLHSLWSKITICGTMLMFQMELSHATIDPNVALTQLGEMFWSFSLIFIYCEFGERVNAAFANFNDVIGQFHWYSYPKNVQRMLPIIIGGVQPSVNIQGYGHFSCNRMAFKNLLNGSFSYFMTLRRIGKKL